MGIRDVRGPVVVDNTSELTSGASYQMLNEAVLVVNKAVGSATAVSLPKNPRNGQVVEVKDGKGDAPAHNITITDPASNTIDGVSSLVVNVAYGSVRLQWDQSSSPGTPEWKVLGVKNSPSFGTLAQPPAAAQAVTTGYTITLPTATSSQLLTTGGAVTGVILTAGAYDGQQLTLINNSANSITFAAAGTSNVADGTSAVIAANKAMYFEWSAAASLWFHT